MDATLVVAKSGAISPTDIAVFALHARKLEQRSRLGPGGAVVAGVPGEDQKHCIPALNPVVLTPQCPLLTESRFAWSTVLPSARTVSKHRFSRHYPIDDANVLVWTGAQAAVTMVPAQALLDLHPWKRPKGIAGNPEEAGIRDTEWHHVAWHVFEGIRTLKL